MKTLYIPKGESRTYESLAIDRIVVHGSLDVKNGLKAKRVTGHGYVTAGTISADVISVDEVETARVTCKRLMAKRVYAAEVCASDSIVVSCSLTAAYVETGKLTTALSEIDEVRADEIVNLRPRRRGMLLTLLASALLSLWLSLTTPREKKAKKQKNEKTVAKAEELKTETPKAADESAAEADNETREQVIKTVNEIMSENNIPTDNGDTELKAVVSAFLLLREQGYQLRVLPAQAENTPVFGFEQAEPLQPAA
ncbi:MAG: hypothetical protein IJ649_05605 [Oscillospiraceae bacterium]|nr:hypothetical protein [Oscillospiraceae bacterium]